MEENNEKDEAIKRIAKAVAGINEATKKIKVMDEKIEWNPITFSSNPYIGMEGNWRGD